MAKKVPRSGNEEEHSQWDRTVRSWSARSVVVGSGVEAVIYVLTGLVFLAAAVAMLIYSVVAFIDAITTQRGPSFPLAIVALINDLLLVLIIMEVLTTVASFLLREVFSLRPFLYIAGISATRRILTLGAEMSLGTLDAAEFRRAVIDLVANAALILIITIALYLLAKMPREGVPVRRPTPRPEPQETVDGDGRE